MKKHALSSFLLAVLALLALAGVCIAQNETSYRWWHAPGKVENKALVEDGSTLWHVIMDGDWFAGTNSPEMHVLKPTEDQEGAFRVVVTDRAGSTTSTVAVLEVHDPPIILTLPIFVAAMAGETITIPITASGHQPLTYQWRKDGIALAASARFRGTTSHTLTIRNVALEDAGEFRCRVSLPDAPRASPGVILSDAVEVHIVAPSPPVIAKQPASVQVVPWREARFSVEIEAPTTSTVAAPAGFPDDHE